MDLTSISSLTDYASSLATTTSTTSLTDNVENAETDEELMEACKEFETYLWEQVVKSMKETVNLFGEDSSSSQMVDYFMDTAITDLSEQLTEQTSGPGSLAQQMYEQMKRSNTISAETLQQQAAESAAQDVSEEALQEAEEVTAQETQGQAD